MHAIELDAARVVLRDGVDDAHAIAQLDHAALDAEVGVEGDGHHGDQQKIAGVKDRCASLHHGQQDAGEKKEQGADDSDPMQGEERMADHQAGQGAGGQDAEENRRLHHGEEEDGAEPEGEGEQSDEAEKGHGRASGIE